MNFLLGFGVLLGTVISVSAAPTVTAVDLQEGEIYKIESLGYPEPIPANTQQTWTLKSPPGTSIKFLCYDIRTHKSQSSGCTVDLLELNDGVQRRELCGIIYDDETISSSNTMNVFLRIGPHMSGGVSCRASIVEENGANPSPPVAGPPTSENTEPETVHTIKQSLFLTPGGKSEAFSTPGYPNHSPANVKQFWTFETYPESRIRVTCTDIRLHEGSPGKCSESEFVKIIDGINTKTLCPRSLREDFSILSSSNTLNVEISKGKFAGGAVLCSAQARVMDWYGEATTTTTTTTTPKPYVHPKSEEIDSSEHGGPRGPKGTTCRCGWANKNSKRIIGGRETEVNEYPFMAGIYWKGSGGPHCGGTIITESHVLTAAHCVQEDGDYFVSLGNHDYSTDKDTNATQSVDVVRVINHEMYAQKRPNYDISLLVLAKKIEINQYVGPACLPKELLTLDGQYVKPIGWGRVKPFQFGSPILKEVDVRVVPYEPCARLINLDKNVRHQICQFSRNKGMGKGDSGGPVVWNDPQTNRYTLVGIPSFVYMYQNNETNRLPDVSADVSSFLPWIHSKIKETNPSVKACWAED